MGHPAGDAVLTAIAARLTAWAGPRAAVGRLGGGAKARRSLRPNRSATAGCWTSPCKHRTRAA